MPMGTVGQVSNGTTNLSRQPHPSFVSAYTNEDYGGVGHCHRGESTTIESTVHVLRIKYDE